MLIFETQSEAPKRSTLTMLMVIVIVLAILGGATWFFTRP